MLKWKSYKFSTINNNEESLIDILGGVAGTNRVVKFVAGDIDSDIYFRVYVDAEQFVNFECDLITTGAPLLPVDIPIPAGSTCKAGFYNLAAGAVTPSIAIGYQEG